MKRHESTGYLGHKLKKRVRARSDCFGWVVFVNLKDGELFEYLDCFVTGFGVVCFLVNSVKWNRERVNILTGWQEKKTKANH